MRATLLLAVLIAGTSCDQCDGGRAAPPERIAAPLPASGELDGSGGRTGRDEVTPADVAAPDASPGDADGGGPPELPTQPRPARALDLALLADEAGTSGDLAAAVAGYGRAIVADDGEPWLRVARAWYLARMGRIPQARDDLERALDQTATRDQLVAAIAHHGLGELHQSRQDLARAQDAYRQGLRSWAGAPLARALLGVTPASSEQLDEIERLAHGEAAELVRRLGVSRGQGGAEVLAAAELSDGQSVLVLASPRPSPSGLRQGAVYRLRMNGPGRPADAGALARELSLGEVSPLRWHQATCRSVPLGRERSGVLVSVEATNPGAGAPLEVAATVVEIRDGAPTKLVARPVGKVREAPLGCRRGWREELSFEDGDGDGAVDTIQATKVSFVRARVPLADGLCAPEERRQPPQIMPIPPPPTRPGSDPEGDAG